MSDNFSDDGFWGVAQTIAGREDYAGDSLEDREFEILNAKTKIRGGKVVALFPGYLFVRIVDHFYAARRAPGVIDLLMTGDRPAKCPQCEIDKITAGLNPRTGLIKLPKMPKRYTADPLGFQVGDRVRILTGSLTGFDALYEGQSPHDRICVLLDMFGRASHVELSPDDRIAATVA